MAKQQFNYENTDYVDVAARIVEFRTKFPEGCLQPVDPAAPFKIETIGDQTFIVYTAAAYRTPDDPRPGIGTAWEPFPGRTPYTRNSELMNAETSAWGRAIIAIGAADSKKGIASREEVRNRQAERDTANAPAKQTTDHAWLTDIERRINAADSMQELATLANEITARKNSGGCENVHEEHLWTLGKRREAELSNGGRPTNKDGSTSRSRATDEQLAANGEMTKDQLREHNRMVKDTQSSPKRAERSTGPVANDPWVAGGGAAA